MLNCQDFTTQESPSQFGKRFPHDGKMLHRVIPIRTHVFLFQDPLSRIFSTKEREERGKERGERAGGWRRELRGERVGKSYGDVFSSWGGLQYSTTVNDGGNNTRFTGNTDW
jgi:hypothetical protein